MFQVTGEPTERDIGGGKTSWGNMGVDLWQDGTLFQTTAHRAMKGTDWTDADDQWILRQTAEMSEANVNKPNIKFATWSGGVSKLGDYTGTPTLKFLSTPQNQWVTDKTSGQRTMVPYTASDNPALAALGATSDQPWIQPAGMKSAGFPTTYGGKWILPAIWGTQSGPDAGFTDNLLGYGMPEFLADANTDPDI